MPHKRNCGEKLEMPLLSRKGILAIAAVIDVALNSKSRPVSAKALASRQGCPHVISSRFCRRWCMTAFCAACAAPLAAIRSAATRPTSPPTRSSAPPARSRTHPDDPLPGSLPGVERGPAGTGAGGTGVRLGARHHSSQRAHEARQETASQHPDRPCLVHDLDSYGASRVGSKVKRFGLGECGPSFALRPHDNTGLHRTCAPVTSSVLGATGYAGMNRLTGAGGTVLRRCRDIALTTRGVDRAPVGKGAHAQRFASGRAPICNALINFDRHELAALGPDARRHRLRRRHRRSCWCERASAHAVAEAAARAAKSRPLSAEADRVNALLVVGAADRRCLGRRLGRARASSATSPSSRWRPCRSRCRPWVVARRRSGADDAERRWSDCAATAKPSP